MLKERIEVILHRTWADVHRLDGIQYKISEFHVSLFWIYEWSHSHKMHPERVRVNLQHRLDEFFGVFPGEFARLDMGDNAIAVDKG